MPGGIASALLSVMDIANRTLLKAAYEIEQWSEGWDILLIVPGKTLQRN